MRLKPIESVFFKVTCGLFFIVFLVSIILTSGKTIFWIPLIVIFFANILFLKKADYTNSLVESQDLKKEIRILSKLLLVIAPIIWGYIFWTSFSYEYFPYFNISRDDIFYSQLAFQIKQFGIENQYIGWGPESYKLGMVQYHYFDAYLINLFSFTRLLNNQILLFICFPILASIVSLGILTFATESKYNILLVISISIIVSQIFYYDFKHLAYIILAIATTILYLNQLQKHAIVLLLIFPAINFGQFPLLILFLGIMILFQLIKKEYTYFKLTLFCLAMVLLYLVFPKIFSNSSINNTSLNLKDLINYYAHDFMRIKTAIHTSMKLFIEKMLLKKYLTILFFGSVLYVFIFSNSKMYKNWMKNLLCILLLSLIASGVLSFIAETAQIFYIFCSFLFITPIIILVKFFSNKTMFNYVSIILSICILWVIVSTSNPKTNNLYFELEKYSTKYLFDISKYSAHLEGKGGRFVNTNINSAYGLNSDCHVEGYQLTFLRDGLNIHTLNILDIGPQKSLHDFFNYNKSLIIKNNYLYNKYNSNFKWESLSEDEKSQFYLRYIKENNINFIFVNPEASVPKMVENLYNTKLLDSKSGEYLLFNK